MMIEQFRQCGYKAEAIELTAETLTTSNYATVWTDSMIQEESEVNERNPDRATFAGLQAVVGAYIGKFSGSFEPRPSGTDATAPDWFDLVKAIGGSVTGDVATFGAESAGGSIIGTAVTIKTRDGAYERVLAGARLSKARFFAERGKTWACEVEATGRYSETAQTAFLAGAHPSSGLGHPFLGHTCTIGGFTIPTASVEISLEGAVAPAADGTHASGNGKNVITEMSYFFRASVQEDAQINWRDKFRNDAAGDLLAVSIPMSSGAAGNVLTWTGSITLTKQPSISYVDGIGYQQIEGKFVATGAAAALTLTQT